MRGFWRRTIAVSLMTLALSCSGYAACDNEQGSCEPSVDDARTKIEQLLDSAFLAPFSLSTFEKLEGRGFETQGQKVYEMRFLAVINYSGNRLQCRNKLCPELHNYLVEVDEAAKKAKIAGWLLFEQKGSGWR
ncbi:MAG TPA: hypothetical protein VKG24_24435 [Pseudolabrys sp.]|nr:hypothetical protein [Pseudolabrys sp.]